MKNVMILAFVILAFVGKTQNKSIDYEEIDAYLDKTYKEWNLPGMAIGIVKDGRLVFSKGYGEAETGTGKTPDENTLYAIASNSKAFTSAIIAMLVEEGKLDWNDKVVDYLPYFEIYDKDISKMVTIKDLLIHRVGLGTFSGDVMWYDSTLTAEEIVKRAKYIPQAFEFRDGFGYSNVMYITAGDIIEKVTGKTWGQNVQERILNPLGMNRTVYKLADLDKKGNWAKPYATKNGKNVRIRYENWENVAATGGLISSVEDLSKWVIFNMNKGKYNGKQLISEDNMNNRWTAWNPFVTNVISKDVNDPDFSAYGLGYGVSEYKNHLRVSHTGGFGGMLSAIYMLPDENLAVILLSNDTESPLRAVPYYIFDRFIDADSTTDHSADALKAHKESVQKDTRIQTIKDARIKRTKPSKKLKDYEGDFYSDLYGGVISIKKVGNQLKMTFEHTPTISATLSHWHYDTFQIHWNEVQPWFGFGVVQFEMDTSRNITGLEFNVPNNDFFFEEFKAYRVSEN